ncbi:MAG: molybdopterin-dependent oxidoreductase [Pseudomonadota bacterium]
MNSEVTRTADTVCPLDCADTCSLQVDIKDEQIVRVRGSNKNPFTAGKLCAKVTNGMVEWVHGDKRLMQPLLRSGDKGSGQFEAVSWERAYQEIRQNFQRIISEHGAQAILPLNYGGPMGVLSGHSMDERFFARLGASIINRTPLCTATTTAAWTSVLGDVGGIDFAEIEHSKLIVIWANNITIGHLHLIRIIRKARKSGAKLVVIDPKRTRIAEEADLFVQLNPGTDVVLAYAVANLLQSNGGLDQAFIDANTSGADAFLAEASHWDVAKAAQICGLPEQQIQELAQLWANQKPASMTMGVGLERTRNGGSSIRAAMALPLLTGNFGPRGAGICDPSAYFNVDRSKLSCPELRAQPVRQINILDVGRHIVEDDLEVPIKSLFVFNHNAVAVHPRQKLLIEALERDDLFVVGFDVNMTDTMQYADVVLPACSSMEYGDLYKAYGHAYLQRTEPVIPPVGESRPNTQVFRELAAVLGFDEPAFKESDAEMLEAAVPDLIDVGDTIDRSAASDSASVFRDLTPDTPTGKAQLFDAQEGKRGGLVLPTYQDLRHRREFTLVSPSSDKRTNSTFGGTVANKTPYCVEMHPHDVSRKHLADKQKVKLVNEQAEVVLQLTVSDAVKPGLLYVPKGAWRADSESYLSINALIPGSKADMGEGACYNDTQVDVVAV